MKPRRYLYSRGGNAAALVLLLCLCLTSLFLLLLHGSSPSLEVVEEKKAAVAAAVRVGGQEVVVQAEVEEALLPPGNARVAFLFIARNRLPLDLVWDAFFRLVFPSSATVYGSPKNSPCIEEFPLTPNNPYGKTKLVVEDICHDIYHTYPKWKITLLRYFNLVGAYPSGYLGEDPCGIPNNLMRFVQQVAVGRRPFLTILGNDYATRDGTGNVDTAYNAALWIPRIAIHWMSADRSVSFLCCCGWV